MAVDRYGLVGFPLGHSFSAGYFAEKFAREGITGCTYENFPIEQAGAIRRSLPADLRGFNITIPHKQAILPLLDELDPEAGAVGAVNCVKVLGSGVWRGYNTDVYGFERALEGLLAGLDRPRALVLGSGGAARAVRYVLNKRGVPFYTVSRTPSGDRTLAYDQVTPALLADYRLLINTTPLGMSPNTEQCPSLPYEALTPQHRLFDLIYNPAETLFLHRGRAAGAVVKNGLEMLILQAERSWEIWQA